MRIRAGLAIVVVALTGLVPPAVAAGPGGPQSVAALASRLSPAVVNISSSHKLHNGSGEPFPKAPDGSALQQYFDDLNPNSDQGGDAMDEAESLGSGFIVAADGTVVTNNHVVQGADTVLVYLTDGTRWPAKVLGADAKTDLAVLKIDAHRPLPFVSFGDSDTAEVGDWVMAIGNPFGLGGSVTLGIVSARNRDIQSGPYDSYIQTDASINEGNSGGPLFDMNGKVVGINTAIIARGGASLGIGFAIPGNLASPVVTQLAEYGQPRRGWLGVGIQDVTDDIAASIGRPDTHGAMVTDVTASGPADGIVREGDIILDFDGKPVDTMRDLPRLVAETAVGKSVTLDIERDGRQQALRVVLGQLDDGAKPVLASIEVPKPAAPAAPVVRSLGDLLGFAALPIDAGKRKTYGLPDSLDGLVVTAVMPDSDAADKGLVTGYVIAEVNRQKVASVADMQAVVAEAQKVGRPAVLFRVIDSTGAARFIGVKLAD